MFADGDRTNLDIDNLLLVSRSELTVMNNMGLITPDRDLTKIGKQIAALSLLIGSRKRQRKDEERN
jgi:hypothetical protein